MQRKVVSAITLTLLLIGISASVFDIQLVKSEPRTWTVDDDGPADFHTIQEAINAANHGDTIYVKAGAYYENIVVNKTLSLVGEDKDTTHVIGSGAMYSGNCAFYIVASKSATTNFTIRNPEFYGGPTVGLYGILLDSVQNCTITDNTITTNDKGIYLNQSDNNKMTANNFYDNLQCMLLVRSNGNTMAHNNLTDNRIHGIYLTASSSNHVVNNTIRWVSMGIGMQGIYVYPNAYPENNNITSNVIDTASHGIYLENARLNVVENNLIANSRLDGLHIHGPIHIPPGKKLRYPNLVFGNTIANSSCGINIHTSMYYLSYHNNFINSAKQVEITYEYSVNIWNSSYPSGGNYWSDYTDVDLYSGPFQNETGNDGIWDHPYAIDLNNQDNYPLVEPWSPTEVPPIEDTEAYIDYVNETIQDLPDEIFDRPGEDVPDLKDDFSDLFNDTLENINEGNYVGAIEKLDRIEEKIYEEIMESAERQEIIDLIDDLIAYLETFL